MSADGQASEPRECLAAKLFVAGDQPNSRIAKENLRRFSKSFPECRMNVEVIDVLKDPQIALDHGIFVTPALQITNPEPGTLIFGNLSNDEPLRSLLL